MKITNKHNLPEPIVKALSHDSYDKGNSNRSITQLIDAPRISILAKEHDDKIEKDVSEMLWSVFGNSVHSMFEKGADSVQDISEERLFVECEGWTISGAIDLQTVDYGGIAISDYKCTSVWSVIFGKVEWEKQLNGYAWLVRHAKGKTVTRLQIVAVLRDWNWRDAKNRPSDYPQAPLVIVDVPLWTNEKQDEYFTGRVKLHQSAEYSNLTNGTLPDCSAEERWEKKPSYAVKNGTNKRAVRVLQSEEEAEKFIRQRGLSKKHWVEKREGESTRCEQNYCNVADYCDQFKRMQNESISKSG